MRVDEAEGVARQRGAPADKAKVAAIVSQTQGWTAGLILMLEAETEIVAAPADAASVPELLFEYFAGEVLQRMGGPAQHMLCMLALMPAMTAGAAERLTGSPEAGALLHDLRKRNYFTTRDNAAEPSYRFHPLFRDFLLERGRALLAADELRPLRVRAAAVLDADGQPDAAVDLLVAAEAFGDLAALIRRRAATLLDEGRYDTLITWLAKLPDGWKANDAWLIYWSGAAILYPDPVTAYPRLDRAFALFAAADDSTGQFAVWCSQSEAVRVDAFGDQTRYDRLIATMRDMLARYPAPASDRLQLGIAMGMATGLSRRFSDRAEIALWQKRARRAAAAIARPGLMELTDFMFAITDLQDANHEEALAALDRCPDPLKLDHLPITQASGLIAHTVALVYRRGEGDCAAYAGEALRRFEAAGFLQWTALLAGLAAIDAAHRGDLEGGRTWLRRATAYADRVSSHRGAHVHIAATYVHMLGEDLAAARAQADLAVTHAIEAGWRFYICYAHAARANVLIAARAFDEARCELDLLDAEIAASAARIYAVHALLLRADLLHQTGDEQAGHATLADAMALGRRQDQRRMGLLASKAAELCSRALRLGVEPAYVRSLIRCLSLPPHDRHDELWAWPLKITTLGGFVVELDGTPLAFSRKTPKRLITLLKAIVAFGGESVPEEKLIDAVWPDEDGDVGKSALTIAIHRLRKLLGDTSLIVVKDGRVGLDPALCWLDVWTFERRVASRSPNETEPNFQRRVEKGLALYRGDFLPGDDELWWTARRRDQMRKRHQHFLHQAAVTLQPDSG